MTAHKHVSGKPRVSYRAPRGFEQIHHHWDAGADSWIVQIMPGEYYVTRGTEIIATVLGSCVSTCIRDRNTRVGGMNHFMLPQDPRVDAHGEAMRYGCFALERLINEIIKRGGRRETLEIKVFGGGQVIAAMSDIGRLNVEFVRKYLYDEGLSAVVEDVGGEIARRIRYYPATGRVLVKHLPMRDAARIATREQSFREKLQKERLAGDVELF